VTAPETAAPETTAPEAEDEGSSVPLWVVVVLGIIIIGFISYFAARSGSKRQAQPVPIAAPPAAAPPAPAPVAAEWKAAARSAYAESRWLYDEMDVELATWRGDTLYEAQVSSSTAVLDTTRQATWNQLPARMGAARDGLYRVESMVGDLMLLSWLRPWRAISILRGQRLTGWRTLVVVEGRSRPILVRTQRLSPKRERQNRVPPMT
jgi:hypothetical protein